MAKSLNFYPCSAFPVPRPAWRIFHSAPRSPAWYASSRNSAVCWRRVGPRHLCIPLRGFSLSLCHFREKCRKRRWVARWQFCEYPAGCCSCLPISVPIPSSSPGELPRIAMDILRKEKVPVSVRYLAGRALAMKGCPYPTPGVDDADQTAPVVHADGVGQARDRGEVRHLGRQSP
jgi:hypothetical protein